MNNQTYLTLTLISALLLGLYFYSGADQAFVSLTLALINFASLYGYYRESQRKARQNPFERIQLCNGRLQIDGKLLDPGELRTVVINQVDDAGIFLTPEDKSITRGFVFDGTYVNKLNKWFRVYAPDIKVSRTV